MKKNQLLILMIMFLGSVRAFSLDFLFTADMGPTLYSSDLYDGVNRWSNIVELGNPERPIGLVITYYQSKYENNTRTETQVIKIFSTNGSLLQELDLKAIVAEYAVPNWQNWSFWVQSLGDSNGSFVLGCRHYKENLALDVFFKHISNKWVEVERKQYNEEFGRSTTGHYVGQRGNRKYDFFAYAKDVGGAIKMDVYVTDANAMGASAVMKSEVTSDLSTMTLRKGVAMSVYQIKTNFGANVFTVSGLPPGLVIDRSTGKLSGKPTQNGLFTVTFFASKNGKDAVMAMKSIRVL
jgi:hypothetical protein